MTDDANSKMINKLREIVAKKGNDLTVGDFLTPEIIWIIDCTPLKDDDRKFAYLRFVQRKKASAILEEMGWYSPNTFTRHNKNVWNMLLRTVDRLLG